MPAIPRTVKFVSDDDGTTLLDLSTDNMIALNETGAFIWRCIARGATVTECVDEFSSATDMPLDVAERDVDEFLQDLQRRGLLTE
jgi:hypothetical protein